MRTTAQRISLFALCTALSLMPAAEAQRQDRDRGDRGRLSVIALQYRVYDGSGRPRGGAIGVGDTTSIRIGETVRLELVGTAIIDNVGKEVPISAKFEIAAGRENIDLGRAGDNWVTVTARDDQGNGLAQVGFTVTGNYEMRGKNTFGRLTLQIERGGNRPQPSGDTGSTSTQELVDTLYRSILRSRPGGYDSRQDYERIRRNGYSGVMDVAMALAADAERQGLGRSDRDRGYENDDMRRVGQLYRDLLKRRQSDADLWNFDGGFADNVRALHKRNLVPLIQTIVGSQEFKEAWGFDRRR